MIHSLVDSCMTGSILGAIRSCLHSCLLLGVPIDQSLVVDVQRALVRMTREHELQQVCIKVMSQDDTLAKSCRSIIQNQFLHLTIDRLQPIILRLKNRQVIRLINMEGNCSLTHLKQVTTDVLHMIHVTTARLSMETGHCHNCRHDVNMTKRQPTAMH
jgi:hypothetical protein